MRFAAAALIATTYAVKLTDDDEWDSYYQEIAELASFIIDDNASGTIDENEWGQTVDHVVELNADYGWDLTEEDENVAWDFFYENAHDHDGDEDWEMDVEDFENAFVDSSNYIVGEIEFAIHESLEGAYYDEIVAEIMGHAD